MKNFMFFLILILLFSCNYNNKILKKEKEVNKVINNDENNKSLKIKNDSINEIVEKCKNNKKLIDYYSDKGNLLFLDDFKLQPISEYFIFKKFALVCSSNFSSLSSDTCSRIRIEEILQNNKKLNLLKIKKSLDSLNTSLGYNQIHKHFDNIYSNFAAVRIKNMNKESYNLLLKNVLKKDPKFRINSFWIVIDKYGKAKQVENYIKHSIEIDNYVKKFIANYKWEPGMIRKNSEEKNEIVEVRTKFILIHYENHQFPQLPPFPLD
jgi:hypothetical protein